MCASLELLILNGSAKADKNGSFIFISPNGRLSLSLSLSLSPFLSFSLSLSLSLFFLLLFPLSSDYRPLRVNLGPPLDSWARGKIPGCPLSAALLSSYTRQVGKLIGEGIDFVCDGEKIGTRRMSMKQAWFVLSTVAQLTVLAASVSLFLCQHNNRYSPLLYNIFPNQPCNFSVCHI